MDSRYFPIIILGMHRSGTTMLSRIMERYGLFQGWRKDKNNESTFFIKLNEWILRELGARWDAPECLVDIERHSCEHINAIIRYIGDQLRSPRAIEYLGIRKIFVYRSIPNLSIPWGWKDPRTTLTLPIWLHLFPNCKVIHIIRHGVDVARSLLDRTKAYLVANTSAYSRRKIVYSLLGKRGVFVDSPRCLSLDGGFLLWEKYCEVARKYAEKIPNRYFEVKYEELLLDPQAFISSILDFCGLKYDRVNNDVLKRFVDSSRRNRFMDDPELMSFSLKRVSRLRKFGY